MERPSAEECLEKLELAGWPEEQLEILRELAAKGTHPMDVLRRKQPEEKPQAPVLETFDIEGVARYIAEHECKRVIVMCGAGISTSAGIPDFRSPGTGLYDNLQKYDLPRPESIFELDYFRERPGAFYELAKEMWPGNWQPTPAHYFIRLLSDKGILLRCYSQNIDSLEAQAGLPADQLVAAHGNFDAAHVIDTDPEEEVDIAELKAAIDQGEAGWQALREKKGNLVKPKIVFFGESLPDRFSDLSDGDLRSCDLLIVMGTSLVVHPFAGLVGKAAPTAPRLLINREPAGLCDDLKFGFRFLKEADKNWRDVFHRNDCDSGCKALAAALGWGAELEAIIESKGAEKATLAPWASELPEPPAETGSTEA